jgi:hypothetical protein
MRRMDAIGLSGILLCVAQCETSQVRTARVQTRVALPFAYPTFFPRLGSSSGFSLSYDAAHRTSHIAYRISRAAPGRTSSRRRLGSGTHNQL